jgi:LysM repeat protein
MPPCPSGTFPYTIQSGDTLWAIAQHYHTTIQAIAAVNPGMNLNNLYIGQVICIRPEYGYYPSSPQAHPMGISKAEETLSNHMRSLWEQHVFWTRLVILSMVFGLPDTELVTNRLLRNPKDFELALRPFYGENIAAKFADLFTSHLVIAAQLVKAAKANDSNAAADAEKRWYANADEISAFLASINSHWSAQEWRKMLYDHLAMTKTEAVDLLTKNYADSIAIFENIEKEALDMADMMTQGIVKQFPNYF